MGRTRAALVHLALGLLIGVLLVECLFFLSHGRYNADEGMSLNAGRLIFDHGLLLYRDFPYSQGPGTPFFYGALGELFGISLANGRTASLLLGALCIGGMAWLAHRVAGAAAALLVLLLVAIEVPALWTFTQIRSDPGGICLATLAVVALVFRRGSVLRMAAAPTLFVWATAFRLTYVVPLAAVILLVAWELRSTPRALLTTAAIIAANGVLAALPMLAFPEEALFHVLETQTARAERFGWSEYPALARFWFFTHPETSFRSVLLLSVLPLVAMVRACRRGWRPWRGDPLEPTSVVALLVGMALLSYLPLVGFKPGFFQYFVNAALLLDVAIVISALQIARASRPLAVGVAILFVLAWTASAVTAVRHFDTWVDPEAPTLGRLAGLRAQIEAISPGGCEMLTFESHLAFEAGCSLSRGLEYSYFSFFADLPTPRAERFGVLNRALLLARFEGVAPEFVALTRRAVEQITGVEGPGNQPPLLPGMGDRYRPMARLRLPVGPIHTFWTEVFLYARSDLEVGGDYSM